MRRKEFLNILSEDIQPLEKFCKLETLKELKEKEPDAYDYFMALFSVLFHEKSLDGYTPTTSISITDREFFKNDFKLITSFAPISAYSELYRLLSMRHWLTLKDSVEEIELIYGEYESIEQILEDTGYQFYELWSEMNNIMYDVKRDYREKLRLEEERRKKQAILDKENKVKNKKAETARKLAELKARREGKVVETPVETPKVELSKNEENPYTFDTNNELFSQIQQDIQNSANKIIEEFGPSKYEKKDNVIEIDDAVALKAQKDVEDSLKNTINEMDANMPEFDLSVELNKEPILNKEVTPVEDTKKKDKLTFFSYFLKECTNYVNLLEFFIFVADSLGEVEDEWFSEDALEEAEELFRENGMDEKEIEKRLEIMKALPEKISHFSDHVYAMYNKNK